MYPCAEIFNAISELTGNANRTSEKRELETARTAKDMKDL